MTYRIPTFCPSCGLRAPSHMHGCPDTPDEDGPPDDWTGVDEPPPTPEAEPTPFASTTSYPDTDEDIF